MFWSPVPVRALWGLWPLGTSSHGQLSKREWKAQSELSTSEPPAQTLQPAGLTQELSSLLTCMLQSGFWGWAVLMTVFPSSLERQMCAWL